MKYLALIIALAFLPASQAADRFTNNYKVRVLQGSGTAIRGVVAADVAKYVQGVYALGIWSTMSCWPLRSAQNAGTGTTVFSLGGLGIHDGTMVDGPSWGADGIAFSGVARITTSTLGGLFRNSGAGWMVGVSQNSSTSGSQYTVFHSTSDNAVNTLFALTTTRLAARGALGRRLDVDTVVQSSASGVNTNWNYIEGRANWAAGTIQGVINGSTASAQNFPSGAGNTPDADSPVGILIGGLPASSGNFSGTISLVVVSRTLPSLPEAEQMRALYKSTLGRGLSLP